MNKTGSSFSSPSLSLLFWETSSSSSVSSSAQQHKTKKGERQSWRKFFFQRGRKRQGNKTTHTKKTIKRAKKNPSFFLLPVTPPLALSDFLTCVTTLKKTTGREEKEARDPREKEGVLFLFPQRLFPSHLQLLSLFSFLKRALRSTPHTGVPPLTKRAKALGLNGRG